MTKFAFACKVRAWFAATDARFGLAANYTLISLKSTSVTNDEVLLMNLQRSQSGLKEIVPVNPSGSRHSVNLTGGVNFEVSGISVIARSPFSIAPGIGAVVVSLPDAVITGSSLVVDVSRVIAGFGVTRSIFASTLGVNNRARALSLNGWDEARVSETEDTD